MTDLRLRDDLELEGRRVSLAPGAAERMFQRRDRRDRRRRTGTVVVGLVLIAGVIAVVRAALPSGESPERIVSGPEAVAGTYVVRLPERDPDVARLGLAGVYQLRLGADGTLGIVGPRENDLPGGSIGFSVRGHELVTDLLVDQGCDAAATYEWSRSGGTLRLDPLDDTCELRSVLLGTRPWTSRDTPAADAVQGDWTATFSCEQMVATVERAPVSAQDEAFWRRANAEGLGSPDPEDPCAASPPPFSQTLRFTGDRLLIYDGRGAEGFDGRYDLSDNVLTIRDPRTRNIEGSYRLAVEIRAESLTFQLLGRGATDPWFLATWEPAPFLRTASPP